jgi:hypothetical protein
VTVINKYIENATTFICLLTTLTDHNFVHEEIKSRLNADSGYCLLLQSFVFAFAV